MNYDEIQQKYGTHLAKRIQRSLKPNEFLSTNLSNLAEFLEVRAEKAANDYRKLMDNPLERGNVRSELLQKVWSDAEELAYLLSIAEDVSSTVRASLIREHA